MEHEYRRKFLRLNADVEVSWKKANRPATGLSGTVNNTRNISAGGICLCVYEEIQESETLELQIKLPTGKIIETKGLAVWINEYEIIGEDRSSYDVGIEFLDISDTDREEINKFVFHGIQRTRPS